MLSESEAALEAADVLPRERLARLVESRGIDSVAFALPLVAAHGDESTDSESLGELLALGDVIATLEDVADVQDVGESVFEVLEVALRESEAAESAHVLVLAMMVGWLAVIVRELFEVGDG